MDNRFKFLDKSKKDTTLCDLAEERPNRQFDDVRTSGFCFLTNRQLEPSGSRITRGSHLVGAPVWERRPCAVLVAPLAGV